MRIARWAGLWLLPVVGLVVLQTYLVFKEPIFSPVDELQHTDYVHVIAEQGRLPIYGRTDVDPKLLAVYMHEYPGPFSEDGYRLPSYIYISYETLQFPGYYLLSAPLYRIFDSDPRVAIYALRLANVALSGATLLALILLIRPQLPTRPELWALAPVVVLAMPGLTMRNSQVTNQVLGTLLLTVFMASLLRQWNAHPRWVAFGEGALLGVAVLTKLTAAGVGFAALAGWGIRPGGLRLRLLPAAAGFAIAVSPWLAWSISVYRSPLPWITTHIQLSFCPCPAPNGVAGWQHLLHDSWVSFVLPIEWAGPGHPRPQPIAIAEWAFGLLIAASVCWGLYSMRKRGSAHWRMALLAVLALVGVIAGIIGLDLSVNRFTSTDARDVYLFAAPLALLVGGLAAAADRRIGWVLLGGLIAIWLVIDFQMYWGHECPGCPPPAEWKVASSQLGRPPGG